jgi:ribosomal protein S18 acetylase RimI-like enzyme
MIIPIHIAAAGPDEPAWCARLMASSFNQSAQQLYRRHGYERVGEVEDYCVAGHSELIFHKRLR